MTDPARIPLYLLCGLATFVACVAAGFAVGKSSSATDADAAAARRTSYVAVMQRLEPLKVAQSRARGRKLGSARGEREGRRSGRRLLADRAADRAAAVQDAQELLQMSRSAALARRRATKALSATQVTTQPRIKIPIRIMPRSTKPDPAPVAHTVKPAPNEAPKQAAPQTPPPNGTGGTKSK